MCDSGEVTLIAVPPMVPGRAMYVDAGDGASSGRVYTLVDLSTGKAVASSRNKRVRFTATLNRSFKK